MSSRYRKNTVGLRLRLSAKRKRNKGENFGNSRKKKQEASQAASTSVPNDSSVQPSSSGLVVPKIEPPSSEPDEPNVEPSPSKLKPSQRFYVTGRRIIDINFFLIELQKLNKHSNFGCSLNDIVIMSEDIRGLLSCFHCKCKVCKFEKVLWTENPEKEGKNINSDAVAGLFSIGCGFENMRELFTKMNVPTLSSTLFSRECSKLSNQLEAVLHEERIETAEYETGMIVEYDADGLVLDYEMKKIKEEPDDESVTGYRDASERVSDSIIAIVDEMETHVDEITNEEYDLVIGHRDESKIIVPDNVIAVDIMEINLDGKIDEEQKVSSVVGHQDESERMAPVDRIALAAEVEASAHIQQETEFDVRHGSGRIVVPDDAITVVDERETHVGELIDEKHKVDSVVRYEDESERISNGYRITTNDDMEKSTRILTNREASVKKLSKRITLCDRIATANETEAHEIDKQKTDLSAKHKRGSTVVAEQKTLVGTDTKVDNNKILPCKMIDHPERELRMKESIAVDESIFLEDVKLLTTDKNGSSMNSSSNATNLLPEQVKKKRDEVLAFQL